MTWLRGVVHLLMARMSLQISHAEAEKVQSPQTMPFAGAAEKVEPTRHDEWTDQEGDDGERRARGRNVTLFTL